MRSGDLGFVGRQRLSSDESTRNSKEDGDDEAGLHEGVVGNGKGNDETDEKREVEKMILRFA